MTRVSQLWDQIETLGFCEYIKGIIIHDDDDDKEDNDEVEDNDKVEGNDKDDDNNDKGISALGLDRDLGFSRVPSCGTPMT